MFVFYVWTQCLLISKIFLFNFVYCLCLLKPMTVPRFYGKLSPHHISSVILAKNLNWKTLKVFEKVPKHYISILNLLKQIDFENKMAQKVQK